MDRKPFRFKQFLIYQDKTAMKVGTDGVLIGAWANHHNPKNVLDIGTGTGLISLMLAQRLENVLIDAIELDTAAYQQAKENILLSKFKNRINIVHAALQNFKTEKKYDLIVSNPPFFISNEKVIMDARKQARQQETLTFDDLLFYSARLLSKTGKAVYIIPYDLEELFVKIGEKHNLYPVKILNIKGNTNAQYKRSIIELGTEKLETVKEYLTIEIDRHLYTDEYIKLTKDFYLKM